MKSFKNLSISPPGNFKVLFITLLSIILLFGSCKKNTVQTTPGASILFVNAIPRNTSIDFYVDNQLVDQRTFFFTEGFSYFHLMPGFRKLDITLGYNVQSLATDTATFNAGKYYSIFASEKGSPEFLVTNDDISNPPAGKAKIRFVDLSADAPNMDLVIEGSSTSFTNKAYKAYTDFIVIDPTTYKLNIRQTGNTTVKLAVPDIFFDTGGIYTIMAIGLWNGTISDHVLDIEVIKHN